MTNGRVSVADRCPLCGRRSISSGRCTSCGASVPRTITREIVPPSRPAPMRQYPIAPTVSNLQGTPAVQHLPVARSPSIPSNQQPFKLHKDGVSGRVIILRQAPHEPMDFDPWRWLAIPLWGLVLLCFPVVISILVWQFAGFRTALVASTISLLALRYIFSDRLLQTWHLTAALNGRHIVEPMPVLMARLRTHDEREIQLRLKGHLVGGTLMEGDRVQVAGRVHGGVVEVRHVLCERTGATIVPRQPNAENLAFVGVVVLAILMLWFIIFGLPWVQNKTNEYREGWSKRGIIQLFQAPSQ